MPATLHSQASSRTRIAIAGAGLIGSAHAQVLADSADCVLCAFVDPSPAAVPVARDAGVPLYASLQDLLAHERPEGVVLATPNALHVAQALECLAAGVSVLVEKPIATTAQEALPLLQAAARYAAQGGPQVLIGHHRAHSPIMQKAQEVVASGQLGDVVAVSGSALFYKPDGYFEQGPWRTQLGGGPILLNMIHEVHNLRLLCGEVVAVQAMASNARRGFVVEDTVARWGPLSFPIPPPALIVGSRLHKKTRLTPAIHMRPATT
jgi:predicted dehydrogenase